MSFSTIDVLVFTHPTCTTCPQAIQMVQRLAEQDHQVQMRLISLATSSGRELARTMNVWSVPTIVVRQTRFVGVPAWNELLAAVEREKHSGQSD